MHKSYIHQVHIIGLGALGSLYAAKLYDMRPTAVTIIADEKRVAAFQQSGITINNKPYHFNFVSPNGEKQPAELIIVAVKNNHLQQAIHDIQGFIGDETIVFSLLNGILSEEQIGNAIGPKHVLYAYGVGMDAVRKGAQIVYTNPGRLVFGEKRNDIISERVSAVKELLERADIPHFVPVDMERALWGKFMLNVGINQASAILKASYGMFQQNENAKELMLMAAAEVVALSNLCGIHLNQSDLDEMVQIINGLDPAGKTSMLQDIEAGRETEVDIFAGTVIALGKKYQMPTPVNETFFRMIKLMEQKAT